MKRHGHRRHRPDRLQLVPRCATAATTSRSCPARPTRRARRWASRPSPGTRWPARPRPRRCAAATRSSTSRASPSPSAGRRRQARDPRARETGTRNLVAGLRAAEPAPGRRSSPARPSATTASTATRRRRVHAARRRLPGRASAWPGSARPRAAEALGVRVVHIRTGVVLDNDGGALKKMLPPFKLGVGGPVAGGDQYLPWIHVDDLVGIYLAGGRRRRLAGAGQRQRAGARHQQGVLARRSAARCTGRRRAGPGVRAAPALRRRWPRSSPRASARCPSGALEPATRFAHRRPRRGAADALRLSRRGVGTGRWPCRAPRAPWRCVPPDFESGLGRDQQPDDHADDARAAARCPGPTSRRSPCSSESQLAAIAEASHT